MGNRQFTTRTLPLGDKTFAGGLNSSSGPLSLQDNEASYIENFEFTNAGSLLKRSGYLHSNTTAIAGTASSLGLHWYESNSGGNYNANAITVNLSISSAAQIYKQDNLDGIWDNISNPTFTISNNLCCFTNFLNELYVTAKETPPFKWVGNGTASQIMTPSGLQWAKYNEEFNNYLFLANCKVNGTWHNSRIYWSTIKDTTSWTASNFIDIGKNDGQEITRIKKLGDRLVVYKTRSIYNVFYTGDSDIPFVLPSGGKANSETGCVAPFSVQEIKNGHIYLSYDGLYYYDGVNGTKLTEKINNTINGYNNSYFDKAQSLIFKKRNQYWVGLTATGSISNGEILVWDYANNAFTRFTGMEPSAMATFYNNQLDERPYFNDYKGYTYRCNIGTNDYPSKVQTAITCRYDTNWRAYDDLIDKKSIPHVVLFYKVSDTLINFSYYYDLDDAPRNTQLLDLSIASYTFDSGVTFDSGITFAREGGNVMRRDLKDRGRIVKFSFSNNRKSETLQIDGLGSEVYLETNI